ncbi:MAG: DUF1801 domain-containing protein [Ilumatobacteraceae bacterium]
MADDPFSAYLALQPQPQRSTLEAVVATLRTILPDAEACMSYGMPAFKVDGTAVAGLAGFKRHCSYFPHSGATLERLTKDLAGYDHDAGTLRFPIDRPLPRSLLRKLVAARLEVEAEHAPRGGKTRQFFDNGRLQSKGGMRDGEPHGDWAWYRKDGSLRRTGQFRRGIQVGTWRTFDRGGGLVKETTF